MKKQRGFEVCSEFADKNINLPQRSTARSAGYDFEIAEDTVVPSIWRMALKEGVKEVKPTFVKTGVKAYMQPDEALFLYNRSSNPMKKGLILANSVGVVDSDYYNNDGNEGHIMFAFYNVFPVDVELKKGERIGQGVFSKFLKADGDDTTAERMGGFGSTDK